MCGVKVIVGKIVCFFEEFKIRYLFFMLDIMEVFE